MSLDQSEFPLRSSGAVRAGLRAALQAHARARRLPLQRAVCEPSQKHTHVACGIYERRRFRGSKHTTLERRRVRAGPRHA